MKALSNIIIVLSLMLIFACSNEQVVVVDKSTQDQKLISDDNVFKGYETVLDKAKGVEHTIQDAADVRQKEMEDRGY